MKKLLIGFSFSALLLFAAACGSNGNDPGKPVKSAPIGNLNVMISNKDGVLKHGTEEFNLTFTDASGKPVEVGAAALTFHMAAMGNMATMNDAASFTTTNTPGMYHGKANIEVAGEWQAQVTYEGPAGSGKTSFPVIAQ